MVRFAALLLCAAVLIASACRPSKRAETQKPPLAKCKEELSLIRDSRIALRSPKQDEEAVPESLEGLELALTFDGLIGSRIDPSADPDDWCYSQNTIQNFNKLADALEERDMPPTVAFVVGHRTEEGVAREWVRRGNALGNMTFQRKKLKRINADQFIEDIERNDAFLFPFAATHAAKPPVRFFRYPQVRASKDPQKRAEVSAWLKKKGYLDAPVSVGGKDAQFSQVYCAALARDDQSCANFVKAVYISTLMERTVQARKAANELAGHEAKLIVGVGANQLICDSLGEILDAYKYRGVRFISLPEALKDPLYSAGDVWDTARLLQRATKRALRKELKRR